MERLLIAILFAVPFASQAQKVNVDKGLVTVDGQPYCKLEKVRGGGDFDYKVQGLDGTDLVYLKGCAYRDPMRVSSANKTGRVFYFDWTFLTSGAKAETDGLTQKMVARKLYNATLIKDGTLDTMAEKNFVAINGMPHTRRQLGLPVIIIQR